MIEIERKFLVLSKAYKAEAFRKYDIIQGFLNSDKERTVRIRLKDNDGFITVKGKSSDSGLTRFEWEKKLSKQEAMALLKLCEPGVINKTRYEVKLNKHTFEVDEFFEDNAGLVIAEVELTSENELFTKPSWLGEEVTGQTKYYNSQLSKHPFKFWRP